MDQFTTRGEGARTPATRDRVDEAPGSGAAIVDPPEHNIVFTTLVTGDDDIVGLVAYSIYKQNKYDWLQAYSGAHGRMPDAVEAQSYLLGESTPRRLATYRHLAEAVLDGRGPTVPGAVMVGTPVARPEPSRLMPALPTRVAPVRRTGLQLKASTIVGLCIALVVLLTLLWFLRSGAPMPPPTPPR